MCGGPERSKSSSDSSATTVEATSGKDMANLTVETEDSFSSLLDLASNNDVDGFKKWIERDPSAVDQIGLWYVRQKGSKQVVAEQRTPLMVAAMFGSLDIIKLILLQSDADVNLSCGSDRITALHCAASSGSENVIEAVKLLLSAGADPNCVDAYARRPIDVMVVHRKLQTMTAAFEDLLRLNISENSLGEPNLRVLITKQNSTSPTLSSSPESGAQLVSSPTAFKYTDVPVSPAFERKEYPIDPSLPDIKNSIYATDEFRIFSFKVRPCSRAYSHDWTECPFVHPGENARRRDPRKFHYSCVPCPDFRKGACRRGDMCEYAHGVFECWLHPAQYRTRLCKDGTSCNRRVCFFAHTAEELRPLYVSTGSAVPSPRSSASVMDMLSLLPGSSSSLSAMSPFNQPMSPTAKGNLHPSPVWPQPNVPTLHLPGSNLQSSRLRSSFNARDIPQDFDFDAHQHIFNDLNCMSHPGRPKTLTPSNFEELFSAEISSSPRYSDQGAVFSPTRNSAVLNQFQQQQSMLSPMNTNAFSPESIEHSLLHASFSVGSPGRMSPRNVDPISPMGVRLSAFGQREMQLRCLSSREFGVNVAPNIGSPVNSYPKWGSPHGKADWSLHNDEMGHVNSFERVNNNGEEPDLSWVQFLVKESPPEMMKKEKLAVSVPSGAPPPPVEGSQIDSMEHSMIGAWLEQMQLDQLVV